MIFFYTIYHKKFELNSISKKKICEIFFYYYIYIHVDV